ncbi:DNA-binding protein [Candidatus Woesearchaeota archaeon]|nr:DNA-binding protein [Candidatus Woesearchaeota archaeon]
MKTNEVQPNQGKIDIVLEITSKEEPRTFQKFGREGKVANAMGKDDAGEIKLTLWNEQVDMVDQGDKIQIINGWCSEWQGEKQLSTGRFGKLEILEKGTGSQKKAEEPEPSEDSEDVDVDEEEVQ